MPNAKLEQVRQTELLDKFVEQNRHVEEIYGTEWGTPWQWINSRKMIHEFLLPMVRKHRRIVEIGVGGGRWLQVYLAGITHAYLVDGTESAWTAVDFRFKGPLQFVLSKDGKMPIISDASQPYVFSWDVFVHFEEDLFNAYVEEVGRILSIGGTFHFNFAHKPSATKEHNGCCFKYRTHDDVMRLLHKHRLRLTTRMIKCSGWGSLLVEARKT